MGRESGHRASGLVRGSERATRVAVALVGVALAVLAGYFGRLEPGWGVTSLSYDLPYVFHRGGGGEELCLVYLDQTEGARIFWTGGRRRRFWTSLPGQGCGRWFTM